MNIVNSKVTWQYRYIDCSIDKLGVPSIKKKNRWRSTKNLKLLHITKSKKIDKLLK